MNKKLESKVNNKPDPKNYTTPQINQLIEEEAQHQSQRELQQE